MLRYGDFLCGIGRWWTDVCLQPWCNPLWWTGLKAPTNLRGRVSVKSLSLTFFFLFSSVASYSSFHSLAHQFTHWKSLCGCLFKVLLLYCRAFVRPERTLCGWQEVNPKTNRRLRDKPKFCLSTLRLASLCLHHAWRGRVELWAAEIVLAVFQQSTCSAVCGEAFNFVGLLDVPL